MSGGPDRYLFIAPVLDERSVERFVKVTLPAQLSEGNLGAVPAGRGEYLVCTRRSQVDVIRASASWKRLRKMMPAKLRVMGDLPDARAFETPDELLAASYSRVIRGETDPGTAFVFLSPERLFSDGSFRSLVRRFESGTRAIAVGSVRMTADGAVTCVAVHRERKRVECAVPARSLVRHLLDNLHPKAHAHCVVNGRVFAAEHLYWRVGEHGLLARMFKIHPLALWPRDPGTAAEAGFASRACPDPADWHVVTDSDEICAADFSTVPKGTLNAPPMSDNDFVQFLSRHAGPEFNRYVACSLRFHTADASGAEWAGVEAQADGFVNRLQAMFGSSRNLGANPAAASLDRNEASVGRLIRSGLAAPFWFLNRLLNYRLYHNLDRMNAEIIQMRARLHDTRSQLANALGRVERSEATEPSVRV